MKRDSEVRRGGGKGGKGKGVGGSGALPPTPCQTAAEQVIRASRRTGSLPAPDAAASTTSALLSLIPQIILANIDLMASSYSGQKIRQRRAGGM